MALRASYPRANIRNSLGAIEHAFGWGRVKALGHTFAEASIETNEAVLDEAARFAREVLGPLNVWMDKTSLKLEQGRVATAPGHFEAWHAYVEAGWPTLDGKPEQGGQGLPLSLTLAVQEQFDRECPAFGMLPVPQRSAARLVSAWATDATKSNILTGLVSGRLGATICISEPGAGSDVLQIKTKAVEGADGAWQVTGEKCWISFGDHDLTHRIVHCVLARTDGGDAQSPEITLFLIEGGSAQPGKVLVRRIEEKLGLHGSPTCAIGFEGAAATLLGTRGRGLAQMFVMIAQMRLSVGAMGLGIASACSDLAWVYAHERKQGGRPGAPMPIVNHPDVQRQLLEAISRTEVLRALLLSTANIVDLAESDTVSPDAPRWSALQQWLLPIVKTFGANAAFANASDAIQVLGGAGYTADWPAEQALRDARVLAVFEGTSGIQALDLVNRRLLRDRTSFDAFMEVARDCENPQLNLAIGCLARAAQHLLTVSREGGHSEAGASAFLDLAIQVAGGWVAASHMSEEPDARAGAQYWLDRLPARAELACREVLEAGSVSVAFAYLPESAKVAD